MKDNSETGQSMMDALASLSKVTPDKRKQNLVKKGQFILLVFICTFIVMFMFISPKTGARGIEEEVQTRKDDLTLSQNLEHLKHLKQEEQTRLGQSPIVIMSEGATMSAQPQKKALKMSKEMLVRMNAPANFEIENTALSCERSTHENTLPSQSRQQVLVSENSNSQFMNSELEITQVSAKKLPHPDLTVPAGEMIPATLETAINSDLPGMVRAITTRDIYSLTKGNVLIPRGSTLVGQFNSNIAEGQNRILVVWTRVQMNDGVIVSINSPSTDYLGRSGQGADDINRHFFERFSSASLLSVLGAYSALGGVNSQDRYNSSAQYKMAISNSFQQASTQTLEKGITISPTLQVNQGTKINVFVAHDLDFYGVGLRQEVMPGIGKGGFLWK